MSPSPRTTDQVPLASTTLPPDVAVAPHDRVHHRGERDAEGAQAVGVDVDLILADRRRPTLATSATPGTALS